MWGRACRGRPGGGGAQPRNTLLLYDAGPYVRTANDAVTDYRAVLRASGWGARLTGMVITHADNDHSGARQFGMAGDLSPQWLICFVT